MTDHTTIQLEITFDHFLRKNFAVKRFTTINDTVTYHDRKIQIKNLSHLLES